MALTRDERALFFPELDWRAELPTAQWRDIDLATGGWEKALREIAPDVIVTGWRTPPLPVMWIEEPACPLRYVCHVTGSVRQLVPRSFIARGGLATNWGTLASPAVAEHALLLALGALRNLPHWAGFIAQLPDRREIAQLETRTLHGRRVGVHGFGGVARALLPLLQPFGVEIAVHAAGVPAELILAAGARPVDSAEELFAQSEVLFECEALTVATAGIVDGALLARLPRGAVFVNVGRGALVDEGALCAAAREGRLRVAVDVIRDEPATPASPLVQLGGALVSPHIGGPTRDLYGECGAFAWRNLRRFLAGQPLEAVITLPIYDRAT
jgi:phosphoglycerate dehydrogenase-like enzyme